MKATQVSPIPLTATFLVERYLAAAACEELPAAVARVVSACLVSGDTQLQVRYVHSTFLPSEGICFCLFEAASPEDVRAVNASAGFAIDRITAALVIHPAAAHQRRGDFEISQGDQP